MHSCIHILIYWLSKLYVFLFKIPLSIDSESAKVTLSGVLDFEKSGGRYEFVVIATDLTSPFLSGEAVLEILVTDSNDQAPVFALTEYHFAVYENSPTGTLVGKLTASDGDSIDLDFSLLESSEFFPFVINSTTGDIHTTDLIDREETNAFTFEAIVSDGTSFMTSQIEVEIRDLNDKYPNSPNDSYSFVIPELQARGFQVGIISASDDDATVPNNLVGFRIVAGNFDSAFAIEIYSGVITVNDQDANNIITHPQFDLAIEIYDFGEPSLSTIVEVIIELTDVNNNLPSFPKDLYEATIPEDLATPSLVVQVEAVDLDDSADLSYAFVTPVSKFMIDQSNGRILVAQKLDAETQNEYSFTIQVNDGVHVARTSVLVHVSDVNDNAPEFISDFTNISVSETAPIGEVVETIEAFDVDSDANGIIYSFSEGSSYFSIRSTTGEILVAQNLETRPQNIFPITVEALDITPPSDKITQFQFVIEVIDSSKNAPTFNTDLIELQIPENSEIDSVIFRLNATDLDDGLGGEIEYILLSQSDQDKFAIDQSDLILLSLLDYEVQSFYTLVVRAQDFGEVPLSTDVTISLRIKNLNDNLPQILNLPQATYYLQSANYFYFRVICDDPDINRYDSVGKIEYSLSNFAENFSIDLNNGEIFPKNIVQNWESLTLGVVCTDGQFTVQGSLEVKYEIDALGYVLPGAENTSRSVITLPENSDSVAKIFDLNDVVSVFDPNNNRIKRSSSDSDSASVSYELVSSNFDRFSEFFSLTDSGVLWTIRAIDKEFLPDDERIVIDVAMHAELSPSKLTFYSVRAVGFNAVFYSFYCMLELYQKLEKYWIVPQIGSFPFSTENKLKSH